MRVVFRVDASLKMGSGHVMRCMALAQTLQNRHASCVFVCRELDGNLISLIKERGFELYSLPKQENGYTKQEEDVAHASWLECDWQTDANETKKHLEHLKPEWLIVDHYSIDVRWEQYLSGSYDKLLVIDDLADRKHSCDILLDQNLMGGMANRYEGLVAENCTQLLGPSYAILQHTFMHLHNRCPYREGDVKRILIYFGGSSTDQTTEKILRALVTLGREDIHIDVVVGSNQEKASSIIRTFKHNKNIHVFGMENSLAPFMMKADLAIGAAGTTSWERLCLGLPSIVITVAENQIPIANGLAAADLIKYLGSSDNLSVAEIADSLNDILGKKLDISWSKNCLKTVDGMGSSRICTVLTRGTETKYLVRDAELRDEPKVTSWASGLFNDEESSVNSDSKININRAWFYNHLRDVNNSRIYIVETEWGIPIGCVFSHKIKNCWELQCCMDSVLFSEEMQENLLRAAIRKLKKDQIDGALQLASLEISAPTTGEITEGKPNLSIGICSDEDTWLNNWIPELIIDCLKKNHNICWSFTPEKIPPVNICFYLGCQEIVPVSVLNNHQNNVLVHESELPKGRGWSPLSWEVLNGATSITVSLIEVEKEVDSGVIYSQIKVDLIGNELIEELREIQARATLELCSLFMNEYPEILKSARKQVGNATYYARRFPEDSKIDINQTISSQLNLLRVVDNDSYPAWFTVGDDSYEIKILKRK